LSGTASPLFWLALMAAAGWLTAGLQVGFGARRIRFLRDEPPSRTRPRVSVVVAARDERKSVRASLASLLAQRLVELDVVAVDDRSADGTGAILAELAAADPRLLSLHVTALPDGWLGKNHALHRGAAIASGEWLLFTDADVAFAPEAVAKAIGYAERRGIEHLAVTPELRMPGLLADLFGGTFVLFFTRYASPWKARDPRSRNFIGIGAFNLVRSEAYREIGGHSRIALRPDDDMKLGKLLKAGGFRQDVVYGRGEVAVEWYASLRAAVAGLEKNAFAGVGYSLAAATGSCLAVLVGIVLPFAALMLTSGVTLALNLVAVGAMLALYVQSTRSSGANPLLAPAFPLGALFVCWGLARSAALAVGRGEIRWRGTAYRLDALRRNRV
jgi:hypothetical protein